MRWTILILNLLAVVALQFLAAYATAAHRTHAFSVYRELVANHALVEKPAYTNGEPLDVERRLRTIGSGGYYSLLAHNRIGGLFAHRHCVFLYAHTTSP